MSKMLQPQQLALSGTRFHRVGHSSTAIHNHFTESVVPLIARLLSSGHPEGDCRGKKPRTVVALKDIIRLEIANTGNDVLRGIADNLKRRVQICLAEGGGLFQHLC